MDIKTINPPTFGRKISLTKINTLIDEFNKLDKIIEKSVDKTEPDELKKKRAEEMISRSYNAFIFDKELIDRFFHASNGQQENRYLMVLLGAHDKEETIDQEHFKAGSFTVIAVGCNMREETEGDKKVQVFFPANTTTDPGTEYPPRQVVTELKTIEPLKGAPQHNLFFKVVD